MQAIQGQLKLASVAVSPILSIVGRIADIQPNVLHSNLGHLAGICHVLTERASLPCLRLFGCGRRRVYKLRE